MESLKKIFKFQQSRLKRAYEVNYYSCWTYTNNQAKFIETRLILLVLIWLSLVKMGVIVERKSVSVETVILDFSAVYLSFEVLKFSTYKLDWILSFSSFLKYLAVTPQTVFSRFHPLTWNHGELESLFSQGHRGQSGTTWCRLHRNHNSCLWTSVVPAAETSPTTLTLQTGRTYGTATACLQHSETEIIYSLLQSLTFVLFPQMPLIKYLIVCTMGLTLGAHWHLCLLK